MDFNTKVALGSVAAGGVWSLATILLFAQGRYPAAYTMMAIGTVLGTSIALVRIAGAPNSEAALLEEV